MRILLIALKQNKVAFALIVLSEHVGDSCPMEHSAPFAHSYNEQGESFSQPPMVLGQASPFLAGVLAQLCVRVSQGAICWCL